MKKEKKMVEVFNQLLVDFQPDTEAHNNWNNLNEIRINIPSKHTPQPFAVFIIFVYLEKYKFFSRREKVAWEIPILYKNYPILLSHTKFGFRVSSPRDKIIPDELINEAINKINKAVPFAEKFIEPLIEIKIKEGNINLTNQYHSLRSRYIYFRDMAARHYKKANKIREEKSKSGLGTSIWNRAIREEQKAFYNFTAMMDAFFSMLEHILVLLRPFVNKDTVEIELSTFIGMSWSDKLKDIYDFANIKEVNKLYDKLYYIKENYRNMLSHGNFQKNDGSFFIHMEGTGAIPIQLTGTKHPFRFGFAHLQEFTFQEVTDIFDEFENFMRCRDTRYGIKFVESGLDVHFDAEFKNMAVKAMISPQDFEEFIEYWGKLEDDSRNMDW